MLREFQINQEVPSPITIIKLYITQVCMFIRKVREAFDTSVKYLPVRFQITQVSILPNITFEMSFFI
jgi:hypothetical protein